LSQITNGEIQLMISNPVLEASAAAAARIVCYGSSDRGYVRWLVCGLCLAFAGFAVRPTPNILLDCKGLQPSAVGQQRIEVPASGFSVLPPQGENWLHEIHSLAGDYFLETPGHCGNSCSDSVAE
jgi:hypothetical protein